MKIALVALGLACFAGAPALSATLVGITVSGTGAEGFHFGPTGASVLAGIGVNSGDTIDIHMQFDADAGVILNGDQVLRFDNVAYSVKVNGTAFQSGSGPNNVVGFTNFTEFNSSSFSFTLYGPTKYIQYAVALPLNTFGSNPPTLPTDFTFLSNLTNVLSSKVVSFEGESSATRNFTIDSISYGAVPEPASWAVMIIGFGAAGSMIRRRKAVMA